MRCYWLCNRTSQNQFFIYWQLGITNLGDYHTKHQSPAHKQLMQPLYLHTSEELAQCAHSARVCHFLCSQHCETRNFFAQNMPETID